MPRSRSAAPPSRPKRRTAEEARAEILDAAERILVETGPGAIRLQQVAERVGVSHPTVLHHFGTREALVEAVVERALGALRADVIAALERAPEGEDQIAALLERVFAALSTHGHGRALAWCALSGLTGPRSDLGLRQVAEATHALRRQRRRGRAVPPFEDTLFTIILALSALFAQSVTGPMMSRGAGLDEKGAERFRRWLARVLLEHLQENGDR